MSVISNTDNIKQATTPTIANGVVDHTQVKQALEYPTEVGVENTPLDELNYTISQLDLKMFAPRNLRFEVNREQNLVYVYERSSGEIIRRIPPDRLWKALRNINEFDMDKVLGTLMDLKL